MKPSNQPFSVSVSWLDPGNLLFQILNLNYRGFVQGWAPKSSYKWSYRAPINGRKEMANCSYFTLVIGVISPKLYLAGAHLVGFSSFSPLEFQVQKEGRYFFCPSIHPSIHHALSVDLHVNFGRAPGYQAPSWGHHYISSKQCTTVGGNTVDGQNPAPPGMYETL